MSDESARLNIHAVLLKIVALLFGLLGVLTLWRFRRLVLSGQADALIPVLWAGLYSPWLTDYGDRGDGLAGSPLEWARCPCLELRFGGSLHTRSGVRGISSWRRSGLS